MLKPLFRSLQLATLSSALRMAYSRPFQSSDPQYITESDDELELDNHAITHSLSEDFKRAKSVHEIINIFNNQPIDQQHLHIPAFWLSNRLKNRISKDEEEGVYTMADRIINSAETLAIEKLPVFLSLLTKLRDKSYANKLKPIIDEKLPEFSHLQLSYLLENYSKIGWNITPIARLLKPHLQKSQFTGHALQQIIRGCYTQAKQWKGSQYPDIAYQAQKSLIPLAASLSLNAKVSIFYQLARLKLGRTTTHKKFPALLRTLEELFVESLAKMSVYSRVKIIESYIHLPEFFDTRLFQLATATVLNEFHSSQTQLKLFVTYSQLRASLRPQHAELLEIARKINFDEPISTNLLLQFLDFASTEEYQSMIQKVFDTLKQAQLSSREKSLLAFKLIRHNRVSEASQLLSLESDNLYSLIQQGHHLLQGAEKSKSQETKHQIQKSISQIVDILKGQDLAKQKSICLKILDLEPLKFDPFFDFLNSHLNFDELTFHDQITYIMKLSSKQNLSSAIWDKLEQFHPSLEHIKQLTNQLSNMDQIGDKIVRLVSKWAREWMEKSLIDSSLDLNLALDIFLKITLNSPVYSLHNMRGTLNTSYRELILLISRQIYHMKEKIDISLQQLIKLSLVLQHLNVRTSILANLIQNFCLFTNFSEIPGYQMLEFGQLVTSVDCRNLGDKKLIANFLQKCQNVETETLTGQVQKTQIELYLAKNANLLGVKLDEVQLAAQVDSLKQTLIQSELLQYKDCYVQALLILIDYDGWRFNHASEPVDEGSVEFVKNHFKVIEPFLHMKNMRNGLKQLIRTINFYETKHEFIRKYEDVIRGMFKQCKVIRNSEKIHVSVCLDYLEFGKKLKVNDAETIQFLLEEILEQIDSLRQVQIVDVVQKICELKVYHPELLSQLAAQVTQRHSYYSSTELMDILNSCVKLGFYHQELSEVAIQAQGRKRKERTRDTTLIGIQSLWTLLLIARMVKLGKLRPVARLEEEITNNLVEMLKFSQHIDGKIRAPLVFRQYMDVFNIFNFQSYSGLKFSVQQSDLITKILKYSEQVNQHIFPNQKLNKPLRAIPQLFEEAGLEYKLNYLFDYQYVDYYLPERKVAYIVDNSIYTSQDLERMSGFHHFNVWIAEALAEKFGVQVKRINAWRWMQLSPQDRRKNLDL